MYRPPKFSAQTSLFRSLEEQLNRKHSPDESVAEQFLSASTATMTNRER